MTARVHDFQAADGAMAPKERRTFQSGLGATVQKVPPSAVVLAVLAVVQLRLPFEHVMAMVLAVPLAPSRKPTPIVAKRARYPVIGRRQGTAGTFVLAET